MDKSILSPFLPAQRC